MGRPFALVLDDDAPLRHILSEVLEQGSWMVEGAPRVHVARCVSAFGRPDLVLLDLADPAYAPEAVAATLRIHFGPALPILATGTRPLPELVQRIRAFNYLQKPFDLDRLNYLADRALLLTEHGGRLRDHSERALERIRVLRRRLPPYLRPLN